MLALSTTLLHLVEVMGDQDLICQYLWTGMLASDTTISDSPLQSVAIVHKAAALITNAKSMFMGEPCTYIMIYLLTVTVYIYLLTVMARCECLWLIMLLQCVINKYAE